MSRARKFLFVAGLATAASIVGVAAPNGAIASDGCAGSRTATTNDIRQHLHDPLTTEPIIGVVVTVDEQNRPTQTTHTWVCMGADQYGPGGGVAVFDDDPNRYGRQVRVGDCIDGCGVPLEHTGVEIGPGGITPGSTMATVYVNGAKTDVNLP